MFTPRNEVTIIQATYTARPHPSGELVTAAEMAAPSPKNLCEVCGGDGVVDDPLEGRGAGYGEIICFNCDGVGKVQ